MAAISAASAERLPTEELRKVRERRSDICDVTAKLCDPFGRFGAELPQISPRSPGNTLKRSGE